MSDLSAAIKLACDAHEGQVDKGGAPYILHPLRVMLAQDSEASRVAAILHDTVEDSDKVGHGDILALFGEEVHDAVFALTRREGEDYFEYVARTAANQIARRVKIDDLIDNLDPARIVAADTNGPYRRARYRQALRYLKGETA